MNRDDVARAAGVSSATVSRVLNHPDRVAPATRERVQQAMTRLDYQLNEIARGLARKRTGLIGLVVPHVSDGLSDAVAGGIEAVVRSEGYSLIIALSHYKPDQEQSVLDRLQRLRVDGLIALPAADPAAEVYYAALQRRGVPIVMLIRYPRGLRASAVLSDDRRGGRLVTEHLIELGHRRIAFLAPSLLADAVHTEGRLNGYRDALSAAGLTARACYLSDGLLRTELASLFEEPEPPTALVCGNDGFAYQVLCFLEDRGLRVPEDISLAGYDNTRVSVTMRPSMTTVDIGAAKLGRTAAQLLLRQIDRRVRGEALSQEQVTLEGSLIVRASTGPVREAQ